MKIFKITLSIFILSFLIFSTSYADNANNLLDLLNQFNTLTGNFSQTVIDPSGEALQQSDGNFAIEKPNRFRWHSKKPLEQLIITDGNNVWIYDVELEQATVQGLTKAAGATPAILLSGDTQAILNDFTVQELKPNHFSLKPKGENASFAEVQLKFKNKQLSEMLIQDNIGQRTLIKFNNIKVNPKIAENKFIFKPPAGVDVIGTPKSDPNPEPEPESESESEDKPGQDKQ